MYSESRITSSGGTIEVKDLFERLPLDAPTSAKLSDGWKGSHVWRFCKVVRFVFTVLYLLYMAFVSVSMLVISYGTMKSVNTNRREGLSSNL